MTDMTIVRLLLVAGSGMVAVQRRCPAVPRGGRPLRS